MRLSIVLPTVTGREDELERTIERYEQLTAQDVSLEFVIEQDHPTCGAAWNAGFKRATGDVLHMTADDLEPETDAWFPAAMTAITDNNFPLGLVREGDKRFGHDFARVPLCMRVWWQDVHPDLHYYSDNHFHALMLAAGHAPQITEGFDFYHRRSLVKRGAGMAESQRVARDREVWKHVSRRINA